MLRYQIQPSFYDLDWLGIISNLSYIRWLEDIRSRIIDISPYPMSRLMAEHLSPVLFTTHIDYIAAYVGTEGGVIEVQVISTEKTGRTRWELLYSFQNLKTGKQLVKASQLGCFVWLPQVKPARIPADMIAFLEDKLSPDTDYPLNYITLTP